MHDDHATDDRGQRLDAEGRLRAAPILEDADPERAAAWRRLASRLLAELLRADETLMIGCRVSAGEATFGLDLGDDPLRVAALNRAARQALIQAGFLVVVGGSAPAPGGRYRIYLTVPCGGEGAP